MTNKSVAGDLNEIIKARFRSQSDCARALGWDRQKLNYIVLGKRIPSLKDTLELAEVLDVSVGVLSQKILQLKSTKM